MIRLFRVQLGPSCTSSFDIVLTSKYHCREQLGNGWVEVESSAGEVYYANIQTKETSWVFPLGA